MPLTFNINFIQTKHYFYYRTNTIFIHKRSMLSIRNVANQIFLTKPPVYSYIIRNSLSFEAGRIKLTRSPEHIDVKKHYGIWVKFCQDPACIENNCVKNPNAPCVKSQQNIDIEGFANLTTTPPANIPRENKTMLNSTTNALGDPNKPQGIVVEDSVFKSTEMTVKADTRVTNWLQKDEIHNQVVNLLPQDSTVMQNKLQNHEDGTLL
jgi:hypothetical protein